jgi:hypothetical protein
METSITQDQVPQPDFPVPIGQLPRSPFLDNETMGDSVINLSETDRV